MAEMRKILITAALPYANGMIHMGHLVEYLQADFWARFQKMRGHDCAYICGDDTHGTPIMVRARQEGKTPQEIIAQGWKEHFRDFTDFQIGFDHYSSTDTEENRILAEQIYLSFHNAGHTRTKLIDQLYCEHDKMFLPDRFVKGTCPKCGSPDQYGDSCDKCGSTYSPADLKDVHCSVCGNKPVMKQSEHVFFKLNDFKDFLTKWVPEHTQKEVSNKMSEWLNEDLRDWDISRDEPYFGFKIPGYTDKYFYVWVDAPIGYISATQQWCKKNNKNFEDYWVKKNSEIYHFIGKDILYFHSLFWPAMLSKSGYKTPTSIFVHGMLTVNGEKMSKSKGTFISARTYLNHLDPAYLRYYYASKLGSSIDDLDLSFEDFTNRVNSDLVGKITNLGSRGAQMLTKKLDGVMSEPDAEGLAVIKSAQAKAEIIASHYENRDFNKALNEIRALADEANKYFDEKAPWKTIEANPQATKQVVTSILNVFRLLTIYLKPILPVYAQKVEKLFQENPYNWFDVIKVLTQHKIGQYEFLATRIEADKIQAIVEDTKKEFEKNNAKASASATSATGTKAAVASTSTNSAASSKANATGSTVASTAAAKSSSKKGVDTDSSTLALTINYDDFAKVDLRVARIASAEIIPEADKLLRLKVDLGETFGQRNIIAGIRSAYKPEDLVGRLTVIVANLEPRKMKFGMSEGMVLAAGAGGTELFILSPDSGAKPGDKVK